jgi:hypothetical protein
MNMMGNEAPESLWHQYQNLNLQLSEDAARTCRNVAFVGRSSNAIAHKRVL